MNSYHMFLDAGRPVEMAMDCWLLAVGGTPEEREEYSWAEGEPREDAQDEPERAWQFILIAVGDPRFEDHLGLLAASCLEDLLSFHGPEFIDRVEAEATANPAFARMLGGVWQFQMREDIWARVQRVWDREDGTASAHEA
jgi:hypothetical protein